MTKVRKVMEEIGNYLAWGNTYLEKQSAIRSPYVFVQLHLRNTAFYGVGFSKCNPIDAFDPARGIDIAQGRAVKDLADSIVRMGMTYEEAYKFARIQEPMVVNPDKAIGT